MRPLLTGGLQRAAGAHVQFDPVNTLLIAMMGEELRNPRVRSLSEVTTPTKRRMMQIYGTLKNALPEDPAAAQYQQMVRQAITSSLIKDTKTILNRMVQVAVSQKTRANGSADTDKLTNRYVREAALTAQRSHPENAKRAFLLALGIFIDDSETLRRFPATQAVVKAVETEPMRRERVREMGSPTMLGRNDLAKHFFVSAHLTVVMGSRATRSAGLAKEILDAQGDSGFSFADMAANRAGIVFAEQLMRGRISLPEISRSFATEDFMPAIEDLGEGLSADELQEQFGGEGNGDLEAELRRTEKSILQLPAYAR